MSRWRHLLTVSIAALPLLVAGLLLTDNGNTVALALVAVTWLAGATVVESVLWVRSGRLLRDVCMTLGGAPVTDLPRVIRELRERAETCRDECQRLAGRLEDLSSSLGDGLLVVTSDLRLRLINRPALEFCGVDGAARGGHLLEILRDPVVIEVIEDAARGGRPDPEVIENRNGLWEVRAYPIREGGAVALFSEVSLVRRSAEFRRRFVQDLSHELRSPLTVLRTTIEALEDEIDPRLGAVVIRQVERLDRLTRELYDLATIESGQLELELGQIALKSLVRDVLGDLGPEAAAAGVELREEVPDTIVVWSDRRGLYRVLSNLVDNAVKYNRRGGWVEVRAKGTDDEVTIQVADGGRGIPAGELRAVLQRFYRVDRARTPGQGGLGLGLAIVKHMVQHMGGKLDLTSREGVGTTVSIGLPTQTAGDRR